MDITSNQIGNLGEAKAITNFIAHGFDIYTQFSGNNPFDFIVYRDNDLWVVEVKTTTKISKNNAYAFDLQGTAYGPNRTVKHKSFNDNINILVCYIQPLDTLCYINTKFIKTVRSITFREFKTNSGGSAEQRIISDYTDLENSI